MIPDTLDAWSLEVIRSLLKQGVLELDRFDFKETLPHKSDDKDKLRLAKACASFANSSGGFLIFGVKDAKGLPASERLVGLDPTNDFPECFGNFPTSAEPSVEWTLRNPALRLDDGRFVHIVHVPLSARSPHGVIDQERWWFCKRTSKGTETMSYEEIRERFAQTNRRRNRYAFVKSEVSRIQKMVNEAKPHGRRV